MTTLQTERDQRGISNEWSEEHNQKLQLWKQQAKNEKTPWMIEQAKPLNILENILLLLQPVCRLTALYVWYVAGLVQPYCGIELHMRDYLNVCLSISPTNMRLLNDW